MINRNEIRGGAKGTKDAPTRFRPRARRQMHLLGLLALVCAGSLSAVPLRVIDETAIPFMSFLSKADFDQRYPGVMVSSSQDLDSGWYVIYQHESLNYYFGPILLESIGQDYLEKLTETVEAAVAARPSIQSYRLELSYEPSDASASDPDAGAPESTQPANTPPPPPAPKTGFWGLVKRIFGFG